SLFPHPADHGIVVAESLGGGGFRADAQKEDNTECGSKVHRGPRLSGFRKWAMLEPIGPRPVRGVQHRLQCAWPVALWCLQVTAGLNWANTPVGFSRYSQTCRS